jgi:predicted secreted protein
MRAIGQRKRTWRDVTPPNPPYYGIALAETSNKPARPTRSPLLIAALLTLATLIMALLVWLLVAPPEQLREEPSVEIPRILELHVGQSFALRLRSRGGAGYVWDYTISGSATAIKVVHDVVGEQPQATPGGPPPSTSSLDDRFTITALAPGQASIHLAQRRPWEINVPPAQEHRIDITVVQP